MFKKKEKNKKKQNLQEDKINMKTNFLQHCNQISRRAWYL